MRHDGMKSKCGRIAATSASHLSTSCTSSVQLRLPVFAKSLSANGPLRTFHRSRFGSCCTMRDSASSSQASPARSFGCHPFGGRRTRRESAADVSASSRAGIWRAPCRASRRVLRGLRSAARHDQISLASGTARPRYVAGVSASRRLFRIVGQREPADEFLQRFARDALAARQRLQLLVRFRQAVAAHDGLHGFGEHFPVRIEIGGEARGIGVELRRVRAAAIRARPACGRTRCRARAARSNR